MASGYTFGELLKKYREWAGLTQAALAERIRRGRTTVSNWERNANQPDDRDIVLRIGEELGLDGNSKNELLEAAGYALVPLQKDDDAFAEPKPPKFDIPYRVSGAVESGVYVTADVFFQRLENPQRLFHHSHPLVGRQSQIEQLHEFMRQELLSVFIICGRGGIGKSKILHAFAQEFEEQYTEWQLLFVLDGLPGDVNQLPDKPCLIAVDDAHRNTDLFDSLLAASKVRHQPTRFLLSSRPQGVSRIKGLLTRHGYDPRETILVELEDLESEAVQELAQNVLGEANSHLVEQLALTTSECPLVTVVGGRLLAEKDIHPRLLERDIEFQDVVLARFEKIVIGEIEGVDPELVRRFLSLVSALSPVSPENQEFQEAASEFLEVDGLTLLKAFDRLESARVLIRQRQGLRIIPDVLSDHILHQACFTTQGVPTGYAGQMFANFTPLYTRNILRNLAELDWRVLRTTGRPPNLLSAIWEQIRDEFATGSNAIRVQILRIVKDAAYYQPGQALSLVEIAVREPATAPEPESWFQIKHTHSHVLSEIPEILQLIGYNLDYLPSCCDLLWKLGRDNARDLHSRPYHPMRVLTEFAKYDIDKPVRMNQIVLEAAARWLRLPDAHDYHNHPLDVVDPLLEKSGESIRSYEDRVQFRPFAVSKENTQHLRDRAMALIVESSRAGNRRATIRAIESLENAMRGPFSLRGRPISDEEREQWSPEQLLALQYIGGVAARTDDAFIYWRIVEVLRRQSRRFPEDSFQAIIEDILDSIPESFELRLLRVLCTHSVWDWIELPKDRDARNAAMREWEQQMAEKRLGVAQEFLNRYPDANQGLDLLDTTLAVLHELDFKISERFFLVTLAQLAPNYGASICEAIIEEPDTHYLTNHFDILVNHIRRSDSDRGIALAQAAVETDSDRLSLALARAYHWGRYWAQVPEPVDVDVFTALTNHSNLEVRAEAIGALGNLGHEQPDLALELLAGIEIESSVDLAEVMVGIFGGGLGIPHEALSEDDVRTILNKLVNVNTLDPYQINNFLVYSSRRFPAATFDLLLQRVERASESGHEYSPLPHNGFQYPLDGFTGSVHYEDFLREVRNLSTVEDARVRRWRSGLLTVLAPEMDARGLRVLTEWINTGDGEKIKAASSMLENVSPSFIFDEEEFVVHTLERAYAVDLDTYEEVAANLSYSARHQTPVDAGDEPFPQHGEVYERTLSARQNYSPGSIGYQFYNSLKQWAQQRIEWNEADM